VALLIAQGRESGLKASLRGLICCLGGLALGLMRVAPQLLPSVGVVARVAPGGKGDHGGLPLLHGLGAASGQSGNADPARFLRRRYRPEQRLLECLSAQPVPGGSVPVRHNAMETAVYVGILPLLLGFLALIRGVKRKGADRRVLFFALLALLALLMALGTPLDALFYFGVPGFSASGSPARVLVLWALSWAILSPRSGWTSLRRTAPTKRELAAVLGAFVFLWAIGLSLVSGHPLLHRLYRRSPVHHDAQNSDAG